MARLNRTWSKRDLVDRLVREALRPAADQGHAGYLLQGYNCRLDRDMKLELEGRGFSVENVRTRDPREPPAMSISWRDSTQSQGAKLRHIYEETRKICILEEIDTVSTTMTSLDLVREKLYARLRLLEKTALKEDPEDVEDTADAIKHAQTLLQEMFNIKPDLQPPSIFSFPGLVSLEWANASITTSRKILDFSHVDNHCFTMSPSEMSEFVARVCKEDLKERITKN